MTSLADKKIVMIIAPERFRDEEFSVPYATFTQYGADVTVASTRIGFATGMFGHKVDVLCSLDDIDTTSFNAVVFVGGGGVPLVRAEQRAIEIAKEGVQCDVLSAICWAPTILAKAGVLQNKKATVWLGDDPEYQTTTDKVLTTAGAQFIDNPVIVDGNIVTANGPAAAAQFAEAVVAGLISAAEACQTVGVSS